MMSHSKPYCPHELVSKKEQTRLARLLCDYAALHGFILVWDNDVKTIIPITLFPSPVFRHFKPLMEQLQLDMNLLYHTVASDHHFLEKTLKKLVEADEFIARLWNIYKTVHEEGVSQPITLAITRSDYMFHYGEPVGQHDLTGANTGDNTRQRPTQPQMKQVEMNLMSTGFGGQVSRTNKLHPLLLRMAGVSEEMVKRNATHNRVDHGQAKGLYAAWCKYNNPRAAILFLVKHVEYNILDQRLLEYAINKHCDPQVTIFRRSFEQLKEGDTRLDENKNLIVDGREIALVYFRYGYLPSHFEDEESWAMKLLLERSRAIKCPTISYMLANTKMVQKALGDEEVIHHYARELGIDFSKRVLDCFAGMYDLSHEAAIDMALLRPDQFVLKPQREGGGNNYFGEEMRKKLLEVRNTPAADQFVLMRRLEALKFRNISMTAAGEAVEMEMTSEMGCYGVILTEGKKVYTNYHCGYLVRSKPASADEGGISLGIGNADSPYWIDMELGEDGNYIHQAPYLH